MAEFEGRAEFLVVWQPFFLFSGVPEEGIPFLEFVGNAHGPDVVAKIAGRKGRLFELSDELVSTIMLCYSIMLNLYNVGLILWFSAIRISRITL